jgi:putative transposase
VLTEAAGEVQIEVPRDRAGTFESQIVKKRQRRLNDVDAVAISLYAKGLTTGEISAHFAEVYGASVSKDTVSRITDRVIEEMVWTSRPLLPIYAAVFVDAIYVKVRDGQVGNRPFHAPVRRRDRSRPGRAPRRARIVGRRRWRGEREVLDEHPDRPAQPGYH